MRKERKLNILITLISLIVAISVIVCTFSITNKKVSADVDYSSEFYFSSGATVGTNSETLNQMTFKLYITDNLLSQSTSINVSIVQGSAFTLNKSSFSSSDAIESSDGIKYFNVLVVGNNFYYQRYISAVQVSATVTTADANYTTTSSSRSIRQIWQTIESAGVIDDMFTDDEARLNVKNYLSVYKNDYSTLAKSLTYASSSTNNIELTLSTGYKEDVFYRVRKTTSGDFFCVDFYQDEDAMSLYSIDGLVMLDIAKISTNTFYEARNSIVIFDYEGYTYIKITNSDHLLSLYNLRIDISSSVPIYTAAIPELDEYTQALKDASDEAKQKQEFAEQELASAQDELSNVQSKLIQLEATNSKLKEDNEILLNEIAELKKQLELQTQTISNLEIQLEAFETTNGDWKASYEKVSTSLTKEREENAKLTMQIEELNKEIDRLNNNKNNVSGGCGSEIETRSNLTIIFSAFFILFSIKTFKCVFLRRSKNEIKK